MIGLLVTIIILLILLVIVWKVMELLPVPDPWRTIVLLVLLLIVVLWLAGNQGVIGPWR